MPPQKFTREQLMSAAGIYQHWSGIATFLRCPYQPDMSNTDIGLIGFAQRSGRRAAAESVESGLGSQRSRGVL
jgi:hypothetical protein